MKLARDVDMVCKRLSKVLHLDTVTRAFETTG